MSLFVCEKCGTVENTVVPGTSPSYHYSIQMRETGSAWCSACLTGTWHGYFPRVPWDGQERVVNREPKRGLVIEPSQWFPDGDVGQPG